MTGGIVDWRRIAERLAADLTRIENSGHAGAFAAQVQAIAKAGREAFAAAALSEREKPHG